MNIDILKNSPSVDNYVGTIEMNGYRIANEI